MSQPVVILFTGNNDENSSVGYTQNNATKAINAFASQSVPVIAVLPNANTSKLANASIGVAAAANNAGVNYISVPQYDDNGNKLYFSDGVHLNDAGNAYVAQQVTSLYPSAQQTAIGDSLGVGYNSYLGLVKGDPQVVTFDTGLTYAQRGIGSAAIAGNSTAIANSLQNGGSLPGGSVSSSGSSSTGEQIFAPDQNGNLVPVSQPGNVNSGVAPINNNNNGTISAAGLIAPSIGSATLPTTPEQAITLNTQFFNSLGPNALAPVAPLQALQTRSQSPYSNRQFIAPLSILINVEGVNTSVDLLTKKYITNNQNTAKQNSVLGFTRTLGNNTNTNISVLKGPFLKQQSLSQSILNNGTTGTTKNISNRVPNVTTLLNGNANLTSALNTINSIPGLADAFNGLQNNPLAALTQISGLNLPASLPSTVNAAGGALSQAFSLASSIGSSNIPASITGAVQLALQVKTIICNLNIPNITIPDIQSLLKTNFTALEKQIKQLILHELQEIVDEVINPIKKVIDEIADFFSPEHLKKLLASIIPDVNELIKGVVDEFTKCNNGPAAKKNDLSGKNSTGTAPVKPASAVPEDPASVYTADVVSYGETPAPAVETTSPLIQENNVLAPGTPGSIISQEYINNYNQLYGPVIAPTSPESLLISPTTPGTASAPGQVQITYSGSAQAANIPTGLPKVVPLQ